MIDYSHIGAAVDTYKTQGFDYIEVPWFVEEPVARATAPEWTKMFAVEGHGCLVGSGEQSFIQLMERKHLKEGRFVCVTPCFRDERVLDDLHRSYFMKVELIDTRLWSNPEDALWDMIHTAKDFLQAYFDYPLYIEAIKGQQMAYDIVSIDRIELGSYGIRTFKNHAWIYGTGVAEPRLSQAMEKERSLSR